MQQGIVIEDAFSEDVNVRGSQYVWIPVGKFTKDDGTESNEIVLGRYEASYASGSNIANYKASSKVSKGFSGDSMSYTPGTLWNFITQLNASKVALNTYEDSSNGIKSDLMNSYAWDTAIVYIQEAGNTNYANKIGNSINSNLANTGTGLDEVCKINDIAANCTEMTTEYSSYYSYAGNYRVFPCISRGGYCGDSVGYTTYRYKFASDSNYNEYRAVSFRLTLYLE